MAMYQFRLKGHLDNRWTDWLGSMFTYDQPDGTSLIAVSIADQAAPVGLLSQVRELGTPLLSLTVLEHDEG